MPSAEEHERHFLLKKIAKDLSQLQTDIDRFIVISEMLNETKG